MDQVVDQPGEARFQKFQQLLAEILKDPEEYARFNAQVTNPESLIAFCASKGFVLRQKEAQGVFDAADAVVKEQLEAIKVSGKKLDDSELEAVAGGSWTTVGIFVGVGLGVLAGALMGPLALATVGGAIAIETIAGAAVAGAGALAFSGGVVGGGIGKIAETVKNLFDN